MSYSVEVTGATRAETYTDATQAEVNDWLALPFTARFCAWLEAQTDAAKDQASELLFAGKADAARIEVGAQLAFARVKKSFIRTPAPLDEPEEKFYDSAMRPEVRKAMERAEGQ
jgi:hypothetical protein